MAIEIDGNIELFTLQFNFSRPEYIPPSLEVLPPQSIEEYKIAVQHQKSDEIVIQPTHRCTFADLIGDLNQAGFELVDAYAQRRINDNREKTGQQTYCMVNFEFARKGTMKIEQAIIRKRDLILKHLKEMCDAALWRVRAFRQAVYEDGELVQGVYDVQVNGEHREPLFINRRPHVKQAGQPVMLWWRKADGTRDESPDKGLVMFAPECTVKILDTGKLDVVKLQHNNPPLNQPKPRPKETGVTPLSVVV